jgi:hypothetical protein
MLERLGSELQNISESTDMKEMLEFRTEAHEAFRDAFEARGREEHEKSSLLENSGSLLLANENDFQRNLHSVTQNRETRDKT